MPFFLAFGLSPVSATSLRILISSTLSASTVVLAVTVSMPLVAVNVYSPKAKLPVPSNVADVLASFHTSLPSTLVSFFVIDIDVVSFCACSKSIVKIEAFVALKLVIAPSI